MSLAFWRGRRVFITGHTGFKGSWLALWLSELGAVVCGYALDPPGQPNLFDTARVRERITDLRGDVRDAEALLEAFAGFAPELVFHLAAQPLVHRSYADPVLTYATNVMGTVHLLEAVRRTPTIKAAVCVTTDKCYENCERERGYREDDRLGGRDPYSSSKACAELVCAAYRDSFFSSSATSAASIGLATARAGNVIGGGDWATDRLVPDLVRGFTTGGCVSIRSPHSIRPWQHVLEPLRGYLTLAERLHNHASEFSSAWNFGPAEQDAKPVEWLVDAFARSWPGGGKWTPDIASQLRESARLKLDCSKARRLLDWQPVLDLNAALQLTMEWTQRWLAGDDMQQFTLDQITGYQKKCESGSRKAAGQPVSAVEKARAHA